MPRHKPKLLLTRKQVQMICNARPGSIDDVVALRDRCLLLLLSETGMRVPELRRIDTNDIVERGGRYAIRNVRRGPRARARTVPISAELYSALHDWLYLRPVRGPYFFTPTGRTTEEGELWHDGVLAEGYLYQIVARQGELAGIPHLCPADLRRHAARRLFRRGFVHAMRALGHTDPTSTARFLSLAADDVIDTNHLY